MGLSKEDAWLASRGPRVWERGQLREAQDLFHGVRWEGLGTRPGACSCLSRVHPGDPADSPQRGLDAWACRSDPQGSGAGGGVELSWRGHGPGA